MIEKMVEVGILFDFYGKLLTKKQYEAIKLYYEDDLSLAEIGEKIDRMNKISNHKRSFPPIFIPNNK